MNSKPAAKPSGRRRIVAWVVCVSSIAALAACGGGYGGGGVSNNMSLNPVITAQPANITVPAGQPATFTVVATSASSYQWMRSNVDISGATQASYTLPAATAADNNAMFSVKVSNIYGTVTSSSAVLTVQ
jgi:hypothetical protein